MENELEKEYYISNNEVNINVVSALFDYIVTRDYLHELSTCEIIPLNVNSEYSPVKWFKINKITIEKNAFFIDKLSMLYMSLHKSARNVILILNKNSSDIELYLGARDFSGINRVSGEILGAGLNGYFPGIGFSETNLPILDFEHPVISSVSAIASLRDDKKKDFIQGMERLINATSSIPRFRAYFIADSISKQEAKEMIEAFNDLYTNLAPAENLQMSYNESESKSISDLFTESFSKSIGESISKTVTHTDGFSDTLTEGNTQSNGYSKNKGHNWSFPIYSRNKGESKSFSHSTNFSKVIGKNFSNSEANQKGSSTNEQRGNSTQKGTSETKTKGLSKQITYKNRAVKYYLDILDKQLKRLQNGDPFGLWSVATYFVANDNTTAQLLANIYRGSIIGEESGLETCAINSWANEFSVKLISQYLSNNLHPHFNFNSIDVSAGSIVTSKELAIHLSFPQSSVPGIRVRKQSTFGRDIISSSNGEKISLGKIVHLDTISENKCVHLNVEDLSMHTFISGSTGSGKSNTIYLLLSQLMNQNKKFLVIESAKGEYKNIFGNMPNVKVYGTNPKLMPLLKINPFEFPKEQILVNEHIDRLVEIFNASWPMYAAMPNVLKTSIEMAYKACGWDMINSIPDKLGLFPTFEDVLDQLRIYINSTEYSSDTQSDYKGALETRINSLTTGVLGQIFLGTPIPGEDLYNKNVIIDLSRVGSIETKAMIMGMLILKLNEFRMSENSKMNSVLKHVTVLEEAHNLLKRTSTNQQQESSNLIGKSVEMISNSIAEMRTYGEGFIIADQSPSMLDMSAIRNTNTKIILSLPDKEDRIVAGKSMGLTDEQIDEIAKLKKGYVVVYQNSWEEAVMCSIEKYKTNNEYFNYKGDLQISGNVHLFTQLIDCYKNNSFIKQNIIYKLILSSSLKTTLKMELLEDFSNEEYADDEIEELDIQDIQVDKHDCAMMLTLILGETPIKSVINKGLDSTREEFEYHLKSVLPDFLPKQVFNLFSGDSELLYTMYLDGAKQCGFQF